MKHRHVDKCYIVCSYYQNGFWNKAQVKDAVTKGWITEKDYDEITTGIAIVKGRPLFEGFCEVE